MRVIEMKRRSLPETPVSFEGQELDNTPNVILPSSVSISTVEYQDSYSDYSHLTEFSEEPQVEAQGMCSSSWRQAIDSASKDELKTILSNMVDTLENGLQQQRERQSYYNWPGTLGSDAFTGSADWSCHATYDELSSTASTVSDARHAVGDGSKSGFPYNMSVQNVYNINNHGTMYFPGAAQGMQCGDYNSMYMSLLHDRNDDDESRESAGYEHLGVGETDAGIEVAHL